jgi:hypothetical protein
MSESQNFSMERACDGIIERPKLSNIEKKIAKSNSIYSRNY